MKPPAGPPAGWVALVGAGPGDPGLVTVRGLALVRMADAVVHDRLVPPELLDFAPEGAQRIFVGKSPGGEMRPQDEINALLVGLARAGRRVVRLKGGDPFLFGRGAEEAEALARAGVPFEVVPGVTSAVAGPATAGIPLTRRGVASSVAIAAGHGAPGGATGRTDWGALARADTAVVLMVVKRLADVVGELLAAGRSPGTPAAVVQDATLPGQRTVTAPLGGIVEAARRAGIRPPAVLVAGEVVRLRDVLGGWDTRSLSGVSVLVTRPRDQAPDLSAVLRELGAEVIEAPAIRIAPPRSPEPMRRAARAIAAGRYSWIALTSANGVHALAEALRAEGLDARALGSTRVAAIGEGTARALSGLGIRADLVPEAFTTQALGKVFPRAPASGGRVLLARADKADPALTAAVRARGWTPEDVVAYRILSAGRLPAAVRRRVVRGEVDVLTFASAGTVRAFLGALGERPAGKVVCIGPVAARAAREAGLRVAAVAREHTIAGLAAAVVKAAGRRAR